VDRITRSLNADAEQRPYGGQQSIGCQQRNSKDGDDCYFCCFAGDISLLVDLWMCCISANCEGHALPGNTATHGNCGFGFFDFWHFDASYCRVKYIQLGYMFDQMGLKKIGIGNIRVYANLQNPFTFSKEKLVDPESRGQRGSYPLVKTYSLGLSLNF